MMKIGIMQGRLVKPFNGHIQEFPIDNWKDEFLLLNKLNLNHVDWMVTNTFFINNPIFNTNLKNLSINSICADNLISNKIFDIDFLYENLNPLCEVALTQNIKSITIPLLEDSNIKDSSNRIKLKEMMLDYSNKYPGINFSFEFECDIEEIIELVDGVDNFKITYDTGNIVSYNKSDNPKIHLEYISKLFNKIDSIHLKDRTIDCRTVEPGAGDTKFDIIFKVLKSLNYDGSFTIQTARGLIGHEEETIKRHIEYFNKLYQSI